MNFTTKDSEKIKYHYKNFLINLKEFILQNELSTHIGKLNSIVNYLLKNAYFTPEKQMTFMDKYNYLDTELASDIECGIEVMHGICCCRHANNIMFNLLKEFGYNSSMTFYYVDELANTWTRKDNACGSNHVVTSLQKNELEIILDTINNFAFINEFGYPKIVEEELTPSDIFICQQYHDEKNIELISKILKKYYTLRDLGVKYIYDEEEYGS